MSNLYTDAIADARKLREVAEQSAKNRIIDAVTPKLRRLIERELNEGDDELVDDLDLDSELLDMDPDIESFEEPEFEPEPMLTQPEPMPMDSDGFSAVEIVDDIDEEESSEEASQKSVHVNITVENRNKLLRHRAVRLVKALSEAKTRVKRNKIRKELAKLRGALIITENSQNKRLAKNIAVILKESKMSNRRNKWLFEGEDELDVEMDFEDAEMDEEGEDLDIDAVKDAVSSLAGALGMELSEEGEEDELDLDMEDEEGEGEDDEDLELELEHDKMMDECEECDMEDEGQMLEIDESMLRRALVGSRNKFVRRTRRPSRRMVEARRRRIAAARRRANSRTRRLREGEAKAMASHFGGGKLGKEMFVDVDENTLLNALAEELGSYPSMSGGKASAMASSFGGGSVKKGVVPESRRRSNRRNRRLAESRKRITSRRIALAERTARAAKSELKESNLFNAKLLYVTKLMQQHTLSQKQQRAIVEAMDNAKTQREAKLLFTSLTESLNKRNASRGKLTETKSRTGSSSRSLRSGQATNTNATELDRWATLAGIK